MVDVVDAKKRSQMMAGIKSKDTKPELLVRRIVHAMGFRFRLHDRRLPGKPDLVLKRRGSVLFVHGCFWHGHERCEIFRLPKSRTEFWDEKIRGNIARDKTVRGLLVAQGWNVVIVWECSMKGKGRLSKEELGNQIGLALRTKQSVTEIRGVASVQQ